MTSSLTKILQFPQYPNYQALVMLFKDVTNSQELVSGLISSNPDFEYAFISASNILSLEHLQAAVYRAVHDFESDVKRTRNVHSEILYSLATTRNIMDSLKKFGINNDTSALFAVKVVHKNPSAIAEYQSFLEKTVHGTSLEVADPVIAELHDLTAIKKIYKTEELQTIIGAMVLKGY